MKFLIFLISSLIFTQCVFSQKLYCEYFEDSFDGYSCFLNIVNPDGFDNFTSISGDHLANRTDADVLSLRLNDAAASPIFPSIVCQQFVNIQLINLFDNVIERITSETFRQCANLLTLALDSQRISEIAENAFAENRNLLRLFISSNQQLRSLPRNIFANQQSLLHLNLHSNSFDTLPDGIFNSLTSLETLVVDRNRLSVSSISDGIFNGLSNLLQLSLGGNPLTTLNPNWFANLPKLWYISLNGCQINSMPPNAFSQLQDLQFMSLSDNNLTKINSNSFGSLSKFYFFYIDNNQINAIDERLIDNLTSLSLVVTGGNPCDTTSGPISDQTPGREIIRNAFRQCFDNFEDNECVVGNLDERVCRLEEEVRELRELIRELKNEKRLK